MESGVPPDPRLISMERDFLEARYANLFRVGHNEHEMILEFGQVSPEGSEEAFHTRIVTAAAHGPALLNLIAEAVADQRRREEGRRVKGEQS
jgi:hypothetical protein